MKGRKDPAELGDVAVALEASLVVQGVEHGLAVKPSVLVVTSEVGELNGLAVVEGEDGLKVILLFLNGFNKVDKLFCFLRINWTRIGSNGFQIGQVRQNCIGRIVFSRGSNTFAMIRVWIFKVVFALESVQVEVKVLSIGKAVQHLRAEVDVVDFDGQEILNVLQDISGSISISGDCNV